MIAFGCMNFSPIHKLKNKVKDENMSLAAKFKTCHNS
jgi:hypothetical protein